MNGQKSKQDGLGVKSEPTKEDKFLSGEDDIKPEYIKYEVELEI